MESSEAYLLDDNTADIHSKPYELVKKEVRKRKSSNNCLIEDLAKPNLVDRKPTVESDLKELQMYTEKIQKIKKVIMKKPVSVRKLKRLAISEGGLVEDKLRKKVWPQLLEVSNFEVPGVFNEEDLKNHPEYNQVILDVNRSLKRFPPGIPLDHRLALQNQLTMLILRVITAHPKLRYYQGYHDIAVTLLLVTGLDTAYNILEKLSVNHLKDCMEPTMEKTSHLLNYIFPLVQHLKIEVYEYLEKSGVGTMFALPWFLTWFGHNLNNYKDVVRLFDYFLASEPLSPLYLSAVIIVYRSKEILNTPCDMANLHSLLSQIPDDLPFEQLLKETTALYQKYPPERIQKEALKRTKQEEEARKKELALRRSRRNQNLPLLWRVVGHMDPGRRLPIWGLVGPNALANTFGQYKYLVATATFAVGLYAVYFNSVKASSLSDDRKKTQGLECGELYVEKIQKFKDLGTECRGFALPSSVWPVS